jgi:hypothetical protein
LTTKKFVVPKKNTYIDVLLLLKNINMKKDYPRSRSTWIQVHRLKMIATMLIFLSLGFSFKSNAQLFNVAGTCTMTVASNVYGPMNSSTNSTATSRTAVIYPVSQLTGIALQELTSIYFNRIGALPDPTGGTPNFKLYLKETTSLDFGAAALDWTTAIAGATLVYDSNPLTAMQGGLGWKQIVFSTNFTYSGTNNLTLLMEYVNTGNTTNVQWQYEYTNPCVVTTNNSTTKYVNNTTGTLENSLSSQNYRRPQIAFDYTVSCPAPVNVLMTGITPTGVTYNWTAGGTETNWDYAIQPQGTGVPTTFTQLTSPTLIVNNLTSATSYEFFVRASCGGSNGASVWKGPYNFITPCVAANIPYNEGFEAGYTHNVDLALCWSQELVSGTKYWKANNTFTTGNRTPRTGAWNAFLGNNGDTWMFRGINLVAGTNYMVKFYARQDGIPLLNATVSASFGSIPSAAAMLETVILPAGVTDGNYQEFIGYFSPTTSGLYYLGINGVKSSANIALTIDDISVVVAPTCTSPTVLTANAITSTSADFAWTENGTATTWEIEYGLNGFTPTTSPTVTVTTNPAPIAGLTPSTVYQYYIRSVCSPTDSSPWSGPHTFTTSCAPITTFPWTENFDSMTSLGNGVFPNCWVDENPGVWSSSSAALSTLTAGPLSGPNNIRIRYNSDATIWTPEFNLIAGQSYSFTFSFAGDTRDDWDGSVYVNNFATFAGATMLGAKFVEVGEPTSFTYEEVEYCFTPTTTDTYTFGIKVIETGNNWYMSFDDFKLKEVASVPGIDGSLTTCSTGSPIDLNGVITTTSIDGSWNFGLNPSAVDTAGIFTTSSVPAGVHEFLYITGGCAPDTSVATITVVDPSSAGNDGSIVVCRNQPLNLLQGLTGNLDAGGVWTNPNSTIVPNGNTNASNIPGQYNFSYIVTNGVCPADTANVIVTVQGNCDYLGLDDATFEAFNMYPNPTSDLVFIANSGSVEIFSYEVLDMNGRVILRADNAINGSTTTELDLSKVENGVYLIRIFNEQAVKTFRVTKN